MSLWFGQKKEHILKDLSAGMERDIGNSRMTPVFFSITDFIGQKPKQEPTTNLWSNLYVSVFN